MLNEYQINQLLTKQKKLDDFIISKNNSTNVEAKNYFGLKIELYEFLNSLSAHKHWKKTSYNQEAAQEELMDILHFSLYCMYTSGKKFSQVQIEQNYTQLKQINFKVELFNLVCKIEEIFLKFYYKRDFLTLICLIELINEQLFNSDMFDKYEKKYQINIKRQQQNY